VAYIVRPDLLELIRPVDHSFATELPATTNLYDKLDAAFTKSKFYGEFPDLRTGW
jgi:hypothetical protein